MSKEFAGFPAAGLEFLAELRTSDKVWFDEHRKAYTDHVVAPTKAFVASIGERLADGFAPAIVAQPKTNGSIAPINNDLRFSPDKSPYKDHLLLRFWEGPNKKTAPTLMIRLSPDGVGFATGAMLPDLDRWRMLIDQDSIGGPLSDALDVLGEKRDLDLAGKGYKKVPKPYAQDHQRAGLLRHKTIQARFPEPLPEAVHTAGFADWCVEQLDDCADIHHWLVENLA